jgi:dolichol-phosphate mannosyltransferase
VTIALMVLQIALRVLWPSLVPEGLTTVLLAVMLFGSLSVFGTGLLGEYLAKVFEEVKQRPLYIRRSVIRDGEIRTASDDYIAGAGKTLPGATTIHGNRPDGVR